MSPALQWRLMKSILGECRSTMQCNAMYCTTLHCTALFCTTLHCIALHCAALHCTALHSALLFTTQLCTALHFTVLHCTALHCTALHNTALHCTVLHCTALHCTAPHRTALHCTVSMYVSFCIGACISICREIRCLPYAGFFNFLFNWTCVGGVVLQKPVSLIKPVSQSSYSTKSSKLPNRKS